MQPIDITLTQAPYTSPLSSLGREILDNFYLEFSASPTAKAKFYHIFRQGLRRLVTQAQANACRGMITTSGNRTFGVWGSGFYEIKNGSPELTRTKIGTIASSTGVVRFAENGYQVIAVDGSRGYILDLTSGMFSRITDEYFPGIADPTKGPTHVACIDTYFIVNSKGTNRYYWSAPYYIPYAFDSAHPEVRNLWWGLQYGQKIADTDAIVALIATPQHLFVLGQNSGEVHVNTGNSYGQLFARIDGAVVGMGCLAKDSICRVNGVVYWLGRDRSGVIGVFACDSSFSPTRVSARGVETRIQAYDRIDDCWSFTFSADGHTYIAWNFPSGTSVDYGEVAGATWIYDLTANAWYRYTHWDSDSGKPSQWTAQYATMNFGSLIMGDSRGDALFSLDADHGEDDNPTGPDAAIINRIATTPIIQVNGLMVSHRSIQFDMQQGIGLRSGEGSRPIAMISASDDYGMTFGYERQADIGLTGEYWTRTRITRCGAGRNRVYRLRVATRAPRGAVIGARVIVDPRSF